MTYSLHPQFDLSIILSRKNTPHNKLNVWRTN